MRKLLIALALSCWVNAPALAVNPDEMLDDPRLERRAQEIGKGLRCLVCQNESIEDSNAELAGDLRVVVRERLMAGDTDDQAIAYVVARYGDYVLLKPPFKAGTLALWIGPILLVVGGLWALRAFYRRPAPPPSPLSAQEQAALREMLREREDQ